jgi:hypothetical protein
MENELNQAVSILVDQSPIISPLVINLYSKSDAKR